MFFSVIHFCFSNPIFFAEQTVIWLVFNTQILVCEKEKRSLKIK